MKLGEDTMKHPSWYVYGYRDNSLKDSSLIFF